MADYISISQAAKVKQTSRATIAYWIKQGILTVEQIAGRKVILQDAKFEQAQAKHKLGNFALRVAELESRMEALEKTVGELRQEIERLRSPRQSIKALKTKKDKIEEQKAILLTRNINYVAYHQAGETLAAIAINNTASGQEAMKIFEELLEKKGDERLESDAYEAAAYAIAEIVRGRPDFFDEAYLMIVRLIENQCNDRAMEVIRKLSGEVNQEIKDIPTLREAAMRIRQKAYCNHVKAKTGTDPGEREINKEKLASYTGVYRYPWKDFCAFMDENYDAFHKDPASFCIHVADDIRKANIDITESMFPFDPKDFELPDDSIKPI